MLTGPRMDDLISTDRGQWTQCALICPTFTFAATAEVVALVGATPVFADVEEASFNLDPESLRDACAVRRGFIIICRKRVQPSSLRGRRLGQVDGHINNIEPLVLDHLPIPTTLSK
jgi:hypothetical protein